MCFERLAANKGELPFWLTNCIIVGFEGEGESGTEGEGGDTETEGEEEGEGEEGGSESEGGKEDVTGLKEALKRERANVKKAEREKKTAQKQLDALSDKDKSTVEKATSDANKATEKVTKLAAKLLQTSVEQAIISSLNGKDMPKFADSDDVLKLIDRSDFGVEQDEDDPSEVTIDRDKVKAAIKKLAKDKKHLLVGSQKTDEDNPSGGQFGGGGKDKGKMTDAQYRERYPSLN